MSKDFTFEVHGLKELEKKLTQMAPNLAKKALNQSVSAGAGFLKKKAVERARGAGLQDEGTLIKSISFRRVKRERNPNPRTTAISEVFHKWKVYDAAEKSRPNRGARKGVGNLAGAAGYGYFYESGRFKNKTGGRRKRPHILPAFYQQYGKISIIIKDKLDKSIKKYWDQR